LTWSGCRPAADVARVLAQSSLSRTAPCTTSATSPTPARAQLECAVQSVRLRRLLYFSRAKAEPATYMPLQVTTSPDQTKRTISPSAESDAEAHSVIAAAKAIAECTLIESKGQVHASCLAAKAEAEAIGINSHGRGRSGRVRPGEEPRRA
jgi:hypothetical protein